MKKLIYVAGACLSVLFVSCSDEDITLVQGAEARIMKFENHESADARSTEVMAFRQQQENVIMEKLLLRNNTVVPNGNSAIVNAQDAFMDEAAVRADLHFYHYEKLKAIHEERGHFNFTSIQSIADEINSLKLLDPAKADRLYQKYAPLLRKDAFSTTTVFGTVANIVNTEGKYVINGNVETPRHTKNLIASNATLQKTTAKSGIVVNSSALYVYYNAYEQYQSGQYASRFVAAYASFVYNGGQMISYPCYYYTNGNSNAHFTRGPVWIPGFENATVSFPSGYGPVIFNMSTHGYDPVPSYVAHGGVGGNYVFVISGISFGISGSTTF